MTGWKTKLGGLALIFSGLALGIVGVTEGFNMEKIAQGGALIGSGLAAWGIGHKIEKASGKPAE